MLRFHPQVMSCYCVGSSSEAFQCLFPLCYCDQCSLYSGSAHSALHQFMQAFPNFTELFIIVASHSTVIFSPPHFTEEETEVQR